jgi:hypothetical protein
VKFSEVQTHLWEAEIGHPLTWIEVTVFGDTAPMFLLATERCSYCGMPNPTGHCGRCGASALRDGDYHGDHS